MKFVRQSSSALPFNGISVLTRLAARSDLSPAERRLAETLLRQAMEGGCIGKLEAATSMAKEKDVTAQLISQAETLLATLMTLQGAQEVSSLVAALQEADKANVSMKAHARASAQRRLSRLLQQESRIERNV